PVEEVGKRCVLDGLELTEVDVVVAHERLDLPGAPVRALVGCVEPIKQRMRFDPLRERTIRPALVGGLVVFHPFLKEFASLTIPDGQWKGLGHLITRRCSIAAARLAPFALSDADELSTRSSYFSFCA